MHSISEKCGLVYIAAVVEMSSVDLAQDPKLLVTIMLEILSSTYFGR